MPTLEIDNFKGEMTLYKNGPINSGRSYVQSSSGQNPFPKPGQLTWSESPTQIDSSGTVITDLILAGKERVESGILYVYAIGHTGRVYKIQVNNPSTYNPDYDNPVLLTTLTSGSPTFTRGGFIDFFGATEKIYIGNDKGVTSINFDGTGEAVISGSWTQTVPRPIIQILGGRLAVGNGDNIAIIDTTGLVTTSAQFPGGLFGTQVRDMDVTLDGNYLEIVSSRLPLYDVTSGTQETTSTANSESYIFKWNGTDIGYTAFTTFPSFSLSANILFQNYQYTFGTDQFGTAVFSPNEKIISTPEGPAPLPNSISSTGNILWWMQPVYFDGVMEADLIAWGSNDFEVGHPLGYWDLMFLNATAPETDIVRTPYMMPVSNTGLGASSNGYTGNVFGRAKLYFSTLETSSSTTKYRFYKWRVNTTTAVANANAITQGVYQTQTQLFSKKVDMSEVRIYAEPWISGNSFRIDMIGSDGNPIANASKTFTAGVDAGDGILQIGKDYAWYGPSSAPTYAIGVMITQLGTTNYTISKIEIDYDPAGR